MEKIFNQLDTFTYLESCLKNLSKGQNQYGNKNGVLIDDEYFWSDDLPDPDIFTGKINIEIPDGFYDISTVSPHVAKEITHKFASGFKLLGCYISNEDKRLILSGKMPRLDQYLKIQIMTNLENKNIFSTHFLAFTPYIRAHQSRLLELEINFLNSAEKDKNITGKIAPYGRIMFNNNKDSYSYSWGISIPKMRDSGSENIIETVQSISYLRISDRLVTVTVDSKTKTDGDIEWVNTITQKWINTLMRINPNKLHNKPVFVNWTNGTLPEVLKGKNFIDRVYR